MIKYNYQNFIRMLWHSFCSKVRRGIGLEPILTRKLASLPQNLFYHNPLREIKHFRTVKNIYNLRSWKKQNL